MDASQQKYLGYLTNPTCLFLTIWGLTFTQPWTDLVILPLHLNQSMSEYTNPVQKAMMAKW